MLAGCLVSLMVPLLICACMRPFVLTPYDWDLLFLMIPAQPRAGDVSYTHDDDESLGLDWDPKELARASKMVKTISDVLCLIFLVIIPFPMYGAGYIMSKKFFTGWTVVVFIWSWCAALLIWIMPVWQSRGPVFRTVKGVFGDLIGKPKVNIATPTSQSIRGSDAGAVDEAHGEK
jgi:hypothetical protein